jgi:hypothetical protein
MSAVVALRVARAAGVELALDGNDPPATVLDELQRHKTEIVAILRSERDGWSAGDWRLYFEERAAIAEFDGGLPHAKAEAQAFECCVVTWLDRNPAPSAPGRCAWCGQSESRDAVVPYGTAPGTHIWLHRECWSEWRKMRPFQAKEALTRMGIGDLSGG